MKVSPKRKLPEYVRFGYNDPSTLDNPSNQAPNIMWSLYKLSDALAIQNLMYCDRPITLSEPFSQFRKSKYFNPPTVDECRDLNELYRRVAIDFAKYMRDHYE